MLRAIPLEPSAPGKMPLSQKCQKPHSDIAEKKDCVIFFSYIANIFRASLIHFVNKISRRTSRETVCADKAQSQYPVFASCANQKFSEE